jgi:hypothetical protein
MDIKVKDIAPANQTTPVKAQEKSDDSFKFTLISNIEERLLKANETITIEKTLGVFIQSSQPLLIQPFNLLTDILMYQTDEHISLTIQALEDTQIFLSVM